MRATEAFREGELSIMRPHDCGGALHSGTGDNLRGCHTLWQRAHLCSPPRLWWSPPFRHWRQSQGLSHTVAAGTSVQPTKIACAGSLELCAGLLMFHVGVAGRTHTLTPAGTVAGALCGFADAPSRSSWADSHTEACWHSGWSSMQIC